MAKMYKMSALVAYTIENGNLRICHLARLSITRTLSRAFSPANALCATSHVARLKLLAVFNA